MERGILKKSNGVLCQGSAVKYEWIDEHKSDWPVVGYIGSFTEYEGLELLLEACAAWRKAGLDVALLLVGSGQAQGLMGEAGGGALVCPKTQALRQLAKRRGIAASVVLPGRVSAEQAAVYYGLLDVVVIPRKPLEVSELVTPMKPLEAAAYGKPVLMSDVAPLKDLEQHYEGFVYFGKGNAQSLTQQLAVLLQQPAQQYATDHLLQQCTWRNSVVPMVNAIQALPGLRKRQ